MAPCDKIIFIDLTTALYHSNGVSFWYLFICLFYIREQSETMGQWVNDGVTKMNWNCGKITYSRLVPVTQPPPPLPSLTKNAFFFTQFKWKHTIYTHCACHVCDLSKCVRLWRYVWLFSFEFEIQMNIWYLFISSFDDWWASLNVLFFHSFVYSFLLLFSLAFSFPLSCGA